MDFMFGEVDSIEKVPEQFRGMYAEGDSGKFNLNPTLKGAADAILGFDRTNKALREEVKTAKAGRVDMAPLSDFGTTPEEVKTAFDGKLRELQDQLAEGSNAKLNLEKIREELAAGHKKDLDAQKIREEALQGQLYSLLVENAATVAIAEAKGVPELLMPFVKNQVRVTEEDGEYKVFVVDPAGDRRYSSATGSPMTIRELVTEMKADEKFGRLFESEQRGGGGTPPGAGRNGATLPRGRENMTPTEKIAAGLNRRGR